MRILLDTQCWLWMTSAPERLSPKAQRLVSGVDHDLVLSAASVWEITIKHASGKLTLPSPPADFVPSRLAQTAVTPLSISLTHALEVAQLPAYHRDPFDRMLIAQARVEAMSLLTADRQLRRYDVPIVWA